MDNEAKVTCITCGKEVEKDKLYEYFPRQNEGLCSRDCWWEYIEETVRGDGMMKRGDIVSLSGDEGRGKGIITKSGRVYFPQGYDVLPVRVPHDLLILHEYPSQYSKRVSSREILFEGRKTGLFFTKSLAGSQELVFIKGDEQEVYCYALFGFHVVSPQQFGG